MKILGINQSHDTSIAVVDEQGNITGVFEEERSRRAKYFSPRLLKHAPDNYRDKGYHSPEEYLNDPINQVQLLTIDHKQLHDADHVAFASFDRRDFHVQFVEDFLTDRVAQRDFLPKLSAQQLSQKRLQELAEDEESPICDLVSQSGDDEAINGQILNQFVHATSSFDVTEHHKYHAICGFHLSPFNEAIVITWDGGGAKCYEEDWPQYQEIECIWHAKDHVVTPLFKRMSNHRFVDAMQGENFNLWPEGFLHCQTPETQTIDGVEVEFTSMPSNGMNFSNMSHALGCDDLGRAAGKVMGMASYADKTIHMTNYHSKHTSANLLEHEALASAIATIQKGIDLVPDCKNIILSGGFSLNCTNNYKYLQAFPDHQIFVDPIPHDGGTAVGVALDYVSNENS
tara:strand:- start:564 stop:1760 length:1197 start_codon:yes stop_codon:yes gene_type:complete